MYRPPAIGMHGMVSSGNALSSIVGVRTLMDGGNAVDAMLATSASLHVTSPFVNGIGGDLFALVYEAKTGKIYGFNGSGRAPAAMSLEQMNADGHTSMPRRGPFTVTVPGCVDAWSQIHGRFGTVAWADLIRPAIAYARDGHPAGRSFVSGVAANIKRFSPSWLRTFAPEGRGPSLYEVWKQPEMAESLEMVAQHGRDAVYGGPVGDKIVASIQEEGGLMTREDLIAHRGNWSEPVMSTYRGHEIYETAPNSQGITALLALNMLEELDLAGMGAGSPEVLRNQIEALKWAYVDRDAYLTDPEFAEIPTGWLLSKERVRGRLASQWAPEVSLSTAGDTTSFAVVDKDGNAVSCIQSNYNGFGSGLAAGGFGLQNRGAYFSLDPKHVNRLEPKKRTMHTIMASMVMNEGKPWILFGCVGGDLQPQAHVQVLTNVIDFGMNIQEAIEAPRFNIGEEYEPTNIRVSTSEPETMDQLHLEGRFPDSVMDALRGMGYNPGRSADLAGRPGWSGGYGYAHGIVIDQASGARFGGADPRWDAYAIGY